MAKFPSSGVNIPGYLNTCNSPSQSGYQDAIGNPYWMGLTAGKIVTLGPTECNQFFAPGTQGYDGAYQWVQLDSGATAANAVAGRAAYILLDSGATQGAQPETAYAVPTVTTADIAEALYTSNALANAFFCGVFLNPATFQGQANTPTPGNWCFIFAGSGRSAVAVGAVAALVVGQAVFPDSANTGKFESTADFPVTPTSYGVCVEAAAENAVGLAYWSDFINRIPF
ncbi:MAG: hypothetical protein WA213_20780 [Terriglobales bacterium]